MRAPAVLSLAALMMVSLSCGAEAPSGAAASAVEPSAVPAPPDPAPRPEADSPLLHPDRATATAPDVYRVRVETSKGTFVVRVERSWAPHGADRFFNLVTLGYYDDTRFFRVIDGFMAQVGYHGDPKVTAAWRSATIPDDPVRQPNTRGMVTFGNSGASHSRSTHVFVNTVDNTYLAQYGAFSPFGVVEDGMEVVDALYAGYGEGAPQGAGPDQMTISQRGNVYLDEQFPLLDRIISARVVEQ